MSATQGEAFGEAMTKAREIREIVADQVHDLVIEREDFATYREVVQKVKQLGTIGRQMTEAHGRQEQAEEMGLSTAKAVRDERELRMLLRQSAMSLAASVASWVAGMDFELSKHQLDRVAPRRRRRGDEDDDI